MLSLLQCVRKAPCCIEVLGSSSHLLMLSRGLLNDGLCWGRAVVGKGDLKYTFFFVSKKQKPSSAGNLGQYVPHTSLNNPTHSSLCRQCCAKVLELLVVPRVFPTLPLLPWQVRVADSSTQGCGSFKHRGLQVGSISMESLFHENIFIS